MTQMRSPGYPGMSLAEAIDLAGKLHAANYTNPTDREAAAKDIGYSGLTGSSAKALADLIHFGLIEKVGKGSVRVSQRAVDILYPESPSGKSEALVAAATSPALFAALNEHFSAGAPSENAFRGYLMRQGFGSGALPSVMKSYTETWRLVQEEDASKSHGEQKAAEPNPAVQKPAGDGARTEPPAPKPRNDGVQIMDGERVIFVDEAGPGQYLKVIATGELDDEQIEALEDFIKRRKKRMFRTLNSAGLEPAKDDLDDL